MHNKLTLLIGMALAATLGACSPEPEDDAAARVCSRTGDCAEGLLCRRGVCALNAAPVAVAGEALAVAAGSKVTLDGRASSDGDGDAFSFRWTQTSGPEVLLQAAASSQATFRAPTCAATLTFTLAVADTAGGSEDEVQVEVANEPPVANAGQPREADGGALVTLDGSGSVDPEGLELTWTWTQTSGLPVTLEHVDTATPAFLAPLRRGPLTFGLTVSDGEHVSAPATVEVAVRNHAPRADAGRPTSVAGATPVALDGGGSDDIDGDALTYHWSQRAGTEVVMAGTDGPQASFAAPRRRGELLFELTVSDGVASHTSTTTVTVRNGTPVAIVGEPQSVELGAEACLDGTGSFDVDGDRITLAWRQVDGPVAALDESAAEQPCLVAPDDRTTLVYELIAHDGLASSVPARAIVAVGNQLPVAEAGEDAAVEAGATVTLNGSGSADPDDDVITWTWRQVAGPTVTLDRPASPTASFVAPAERSHLEFELVVRDGLSESQPDRVRVDVANRPPTADAGDDLAIALGTPVSLDGTRSADVDGDLLDYRWRQVAGTPVLLDETDAAPVFVTPSRPDTLVFELAVSDGYVSSTPDAVAVTVRDLTPTLEP